MENEALSRTQEAKLAKLAEEFFTGDEQPLPGISARGAENRLAAMKTLQSIRSGGKPWKKKSML